MKFKYPLEKALRHREIVETLAQREFQETLGQLTIEQNKLDDLYAQEKRARGSLLDFQTGSSPDLPQQGAHLDQFLKLQVLRIEAQKTKVKEAEKRVEEKREILRAAAVNRKILVKHKEQKKQSFTEEMNRKEQAEIDELSVLRHERRHGSQGRE